MTIPPANPPAVFCSFPQYWFSCQVNPYYSATSYLLQNKILGIIDINKTDFDVNWVIFGGVPGDIYYDYYIQNKALDLRVVEVEPGVFIEYYRLTNSYWNRMLSEHQTHDLYRTECSWNDYTPT